MKRLIAALGCVLALGVAGAAQSSPADAPAPVPRPAEEDASPAAAPRENAKTSVEPDAASPRGRYRGILLREAAKAGLPADIADAVVAVESGYDPTVIGGVGEIGLMQVRPQTAAMLGFRGDDAELARPEVNIRYGVAYLAGAWRLAGGDLCRTLMKYRAGHGEERMTPLSVAYCGRARAHLAAVGSPHATGAVIPASVGVTPAAPRSFAYRPTARRGTEAASRSFWAAHEARVAAITRKLHAKWRRMASR
ncbi:lytic transglycosylase domain-containing protein [Methylocella sp.]|uniref:lytic transglycosylase domain-containing protein n=1 Tax=Methylocella sp. TaxID=1978226 RepID=UPI003783160D